MKTRSSVRLPAAVVLCSAALLAAPSARAVTSNVRFDGLGGAGISQASASTSGIPIMAVDQLGSASGLTVDQDLVEGSVALGPPATATSLWTVTNDTGMSFLDVFLVFETTVDYETVIGGQLRQIHYDPEDVGLALHNGIGGLDWVILQVPSGPDMGYYPAVSLGSLGAGQTSSQFAVNYIVDDLSNLFLTPTGFTLGLPQWQLRSVFVPIPEPSSVLLVAAGLGMLVARRRRRA